jgi:pterin-4a-carbinolamine dehydratase/uncharacterized protein YndB with AHSA1/START domain
MTLENEQCIPCRGSVEPLPRAESEALAAGLPGWALDGDATRIAKTFRFPDFAGALEFVRRVAEIAEAEGHHPDLAFGWGYCTVTFRTHRIHGLHRNDFIMAARTEALAAAPAEGANPMETADFSYVTYIAAAPEAVWNALLDQETTRKYWEHANVSDWRPGSRWEHRDLENREHVDIVGKVVEFVPPRRLVLTWVDPADEGREEKYSRVTIEIGPTAGVTRLSVAHDRLEAGSEMLKGISEGWPIVLSSLKTLLETGRALPRLWDREAA